MLNLMSKQIDTQVNKSIKFQAQNIQNIWDIMKRPNLSIIEIEKQKPDLNLKKEATIKIKEASIKIQKIK